jgi:DNA adenine methylase
MGFDQLLREAEDAVSDFRTSKDRSTRSLYQSLERVFILKKRAEGDPQAFMKFARSIYVEKGWGKVTQGSTRNLFTVPLRLAFGTDKDQQPTISRYAAALQHLEATTPHLDASNGAVVARLEECGGVENLVAEARQARRSSGQAATPEEEAEADEQAVLRNQPLASFQIDARPGFKLMLVHVDDNGQACVLADEGAERAKAAIKRAADFRYERITPIPYIGNKTRQLRLLDGWLPEDIEEYREPFVGSGAVFLMLRRTRPNSNIRYWINDASKGLISLWREIQADPEPLLREATAILDATAGSFEQAKIVGDQLWPKRISDDRLEAAVAYLITKLWAYNHKDKRGVYRSKVRPAYPETFDRIRAVQPLLDGVKITNFRRDEVFREPSVLSDHRKVFMFVDPPYDDEEGVYEEFLGERTPGASKEVQEEERAVAHWNLIQLLTDSPYRWLMTHSQTEAFRSRAVFARLATPSETRFHEHTVFSGMKSEDNSEALLANYDPDGWAMPSWAVRVPQGEPPVDWDEVRRQAANGEGVSPFEDA